MIKKRVLIVEDEILTAICLKNLLEENGFEIIDIAYKGKEAIDKSLKSKPDMILMDIFLRNHITGIEVVEEIRRHYDIPIIYITANSDIETRKKAMTTKPVCIIEKPYNEFLLISKIKTYFDNAV
jgi:CheY-like chemotaxis protein